MDVTLQKPSPSILKNYLFNFMCMCIPECADHTMWVPAALRGQKSVSDPLELELLAVVSLLILGTGNPALVPLQEQSVLLIAEPSPLPTPTTPPNI